MFLNKIAGLSDFEQSISQETDSHAIFIQDLNGRVLYWSRGAEQLYGWHPLEVTGQAVNELFQCSESSIQEIIHALLLHEEWQGKMSVNSKKSPPVFAGAYWKLILDKTGQPICILSEHVESLVEGPASSLNSQRQLHQTLEKLIANMAHDLNNIFTPIIAMSQFLRVTLPSNHDLMQKRIALIECTAKRGVDMVKHTLNYAKGLTEGLMPVNISIVLQEVVGVIQCGFPEAIQVSYQVSDSSLPIMVWANSNQLHRVFMNLCINARDAMPNGGTLTLTVRQAIIDETLADSIPGLPPGKYAVVTVEDTGTGIPPEVQSRIFEPFFTTKERGRAVGLGLVSTLEIVKSHGGFIRFSSVVGHGTNFKIFLPLHPSDLDYCDLHEIFQQVSKC